MGFQALEVEEVQFDGENMVFKGGFSCNHALGRVKANSGHVQFQKESPVEMILQGDVEIDLQEGGHLSCLHTALDCVKSIGVFHGTLEEKACYERKEQSLLLKSVRMELHFAKSSERLLLNQMIAQEGVEIRLNNSVQLEGDLVTFSDFDQEGHCAFAYLISNSDAPCKVLDSTRGEIESRSILLNLNQKNVLLDAPHGMLQKEPPIRFEAATLIVDASTDTLTLTPPIKIEGIGLLSTEGEMQIKRGAQKQFSSLHCDGRSVLKLKDPDKGLEHTLTVYGTIDIDHTHSKCILKSPIQNEKQVHLQDAYGEIFADQMTLHYQVQEGRTVPTKLFLEGHVKLQNLALGAKQYGLSEQAEFYFATHELVLKGSPVLFLDQVNKVQASAPLLRIKRDLGSQKDIIQGTGNVRFVFAQEELNELKKRFSLDIEK